MVHIGHSTHPKLLEKLPDGWRRRQGDGYAVVCPPAGQQRQAFAASVARGLGRQPRRLPCRWLYDDVGSALFEEITRQPEYYQTRTEEAILRHCAMSLHDRTGHVTVVELGSGSSSKTHRLLEAWMAHGPTSYVPLDISHAALDAACASLAGAFPGIRVEGIASTYETGLPLAARLSPLMLTFLGSTIGNFDPVATDLFLAMLASHLAPHDFLLLGIDLVKDIPRLEAAYNDAAGVTARFTLNLFARMNRELGCRVPLDALEHVARYNTELDQIEIHACVRRDICIELPPPGAGEFHLSAGEEVLVEISRKFRPDDMAATLDRAGFDLEQTETDAEELFAVQLFRRRAGHAGKSM